MAASTLKPPILRRDGTSQRMRRPAALDPSSARVDERSVADLIAFAREYGKELIYHDAEDHPDGDWSGFIDPGLGIDALARLIEDPERIADARVLTACPPHVALFLSFLKLLGYAQDHLNTLTRRHLEFYYDAVLGMTRRAPVPDRANVIVRLGRGVERALLPAGTLLDAGKDSRGKDRAYRTDRDAVISRAQIARLSSVHVEKRVTTIRGAREEHLDDRDAGLLAALSIALGDPRPGDPLPPYKGAEQVDIALLRELHGLVAFAETHLFLDLFELCSLMQLLQRRDDARGEWNQINGYLKDAARARLGDPTYRFEPTDPRAFAANVALAMGGAPDLGSLPDIVSLEDLYAQRARQDARDFITQSLYFADLEEFYRMMQLKLRYDSEWREVNRILELGGQRKRADLSYRLTPADPAAFTENLTAALGPLDLTALGISTFRGYCQEIQCVEGAFWMPIEDFAYMMAVHEAGDSSETAQRRADDILAAAHERKEYAAHRERLERLGEDPNDPLNAFVRPVARKIEWLDIHPFDDATTVTARPDRRPDPASPRWRTFGDARPRTEQDSPPSPVLGWAVSSPLLALREGKRRIVLTLGFEPGGFDADRVASALASEPFAVEISTAKGYRAIGSVSIAQGDYQALSGVARALSAPLPALRLALDLGEDADPITAPPPGNGARPTAAWPALRLMLRPIWNPAAGRFTTPYDAFKDLALGAVHIAVEARGMTALTLENDRSALDAGKPFQPFGMSPSVGSRFYLGHIELVHKRLDSLRFHVEWMQAPADLAAHYAGYGITPDFRARIALFDRQRELTLAEAAPLFAASNPRAAHTIEILDVPSALQAASPPYTYEGAEDAVTAGGRASRWSRHIVWELTPIDLQHHAYPRIAAIKAGELAAAVARQAQTGVQTPVDVAAYQVNPPYTPTVKRLTVDHAASVEVLPGSGAGPSDERLYHVHPFGCCEAMDGPGALFLPPYDDHEGELYLGIRDVRPPETLSILFQMAQGSADADLEPAAVEWSYLSGDRWISLHDGQIRSDATRGLLDTGIIELSLDAAAPSARMPGGLYWLRAALRHGTRSICDAVAVHTQAVPATFVDRENAPDHHESPLAPGSITRLVEPVRRIAAIEQPYTSYGGRAAERDAEHHARVSERLRHKDRGLTIWDHERLVLARFSQIYRVKCLPADITESPGDPGRVVVVVIPNVRRQVPFDPFEARVSAATLAEIQAYLEGKIPPHARVEVRNAHFVAVKVRVMVRFVPGGDEGFYRKQLSDDLCRFLSPWAYEDGVDITIGDRIYGSSIADFVDRRPYVDHVAGITLFRGQGAGFIEVEPPESGDAYVSADRPDAVLVAAREHEIDTSWQDRDKRLAEAAAPAAEVATGIGHMRVGLDFMITQRVAAEMGIEKMLLEIDFMVG